MTLTPARIGSAPPSSSLEVRERFVEALKLDLVEPWAGHDFAEEQLPGWVRPSNWYLTGFLIPSGVTLLLNIQQRRGDTTAADHLVRTFADRLWGEDWPGTSRPLVFYDPRALDLEGPAGMLRAKAIVTDEEAVL
jgi:hypothetical protein